MISDAPKNNLKDLHYSKHQFLITYRIKHTSEVKHLKNISDS